MKKLRLLSAFCSSIFAFGVVATANAAFLGISSGGNVYSIDGATGSISLVGSSGISFGTPNSMAKDSAGTLFTATEQLFTIDPITGAATNVVNLPFRGKNLRGIAFDSSDILFGIDSVADVDVNDVLVTVDTTTGEVTTIGTDLGFSGIQGLTYAPDGTLYAWDIGDGLLTIDPTTGLATDVNSSVGGDSQGGAFMPIQSLAFDDSGVLYGARHDLFTIDLSSGASTLVGSGNSTEFDIRGFEAVIPIPAAVWLFGSGLICLVGFARRKTS